MCVILSGSFKALYTCKQSKSNRRELSKTDLFINNTKAHLFFHDSITAAPVEAITNCVSSCVGQKDGNYQSCDTCSGFVMCSNELMYNMDCAAGTISRHDKFKSKNAKRFFSRLVMVPSQTHHIAMITKVITQLFGVMIELACTEVI